MDDQMKKNKFMSDITGLIGGGIGTALGTGLSAAISKNAYGSAS
jgi:hypothetical protein